MQKVHLNGLELTSSNVIKVVDALSTDEVRKLNRAAWRKRQQASKLLELARGRHEVAQAEVEICTAICRATFRKMAA